MKFSEEIRERKRYREPCLGMCSPIEEPVFESMRWKATSTKLSLLMVIVVLIFGLTSPANGFNPLQRSWLHDDKSDVIPLESLRFADGGWSKGRDEGFALALQKTTSNFYLWINDNKSLPVGTRLLCKGQIADRNGTPVLVDSITTFTMGKLLGKNSDFLVAVTNGGTSLLAWDFKNCKGIETYRAAAALRLASRRNTKPSLRGDIITGDFSGTGTDLIQIIDRDTSELSRWELTPQGFHLVKHSVINVSASSTSKIEGIGFVGVTKVPHNNENIAYESATMVLHNRGFTLIHDIKPKSFAPDCNFYPIGCTGKTLVFSLDQGFSDGFQDLARKNRPLADELLNRTISELKRLQSRYTVWALINPIQQDRQATIFVLDKLAKAGIPFVLDYYSSDVTNLAYLKKEWLDYTPRAFDASKGLSLNISGRTTNHSSVQFFSGRYGSLFIGLRFMERLGMALNANDPRGQPIIADVILAKRSLTFDWQVALDAVKWASASGRYIIWADPAMYIPYACYMSAPELKKATQLRDDYLHREMSLVKQYPNIIPMYDNNEGLKRCGVAYGDWLVTPRNFRISRWEATPAHLALSKHGLGPLQGTKGFGLSVQSWTTDGDPVLTALTLPPAEVAMWTLDAFAKQATIIEYEPYFYFFFWPSFPDTFKSFESEHIQNIGKSRPSLDLLLLTLGIAQNK